MNQRGDFTFDYLWHIFDAFLMFALGGASVVAAAIWHSKVSTKQYELDRQELESRVKQLERIFDMINVKLDHMTEELNRRIEHLTERMDRLQG